MVWNATDSSGALCRQQDPPLQKSLQNCSLKCNLSEPIHISNPLLFEVALYGLTPERILFKGNIVVRISAFTKHNKEYMQGRSVFKIRLLSCILQFPLCHFLHLVPSVEVKVRRHPRWLHHHFQDLNTCTETVKFVFTSLCALLFQA